MWTVAWWHHCFLIEAQAHVLLTQFDKVILIVPPYQAKRRLVAHLVASPSRKNGKHVNLMDKELQRMAM